VARSGVAVVGAAGVGAVMVAGGSIVAIIGGSRGKGRVAGAAAGQQYVYRHRTPDTL